MYKDNINDSLMRNFGEELTRFVKIKNIAMTIVLVICQLAFILNSAISSTLGFFIAKKNLFGLIRFILKKMDKKKDEEEGTQLADLDEKGTVLEKEKKEEKEYLGERGEFWITLLLYLSLTAIALTTDKIIGFAHFSGATVSNFICVISPGIFYLYFSRKKPFSFTKLLAIYMLLLGSFLILGFFGFNFLKLIK